MGMTTVAQALYQALESRCIGLFQKSLAHTGGKNRMRRAHLKKKCPSPGCAWKIAWDSLGNTSGKISLFGPVHFARCWP
jgi:hypothetical protein